MALPDDPVTEQVDFYILGDPDQTGKLRIACQIAQKAYSRGLNVYLQTDGEAQSVELDRLLWTFSQGSFIPHTIAAREHTPWDDYPVQLGTEMDDLESVDVLINLVTGVPDRYQRFRRIVELVGADADEKSAGRQRFRYYRDQGLEPNTHLLA